MRTVSGPTCSTALLVALANFPGGLGGDAYTCSGFHCGPAFVHLPQHQCPNDRPHRLHSAAQQLLDLSSFLSRKLNLQSSTLAHASAILLGYIFAKYLSRLRIYQGMVLCHQTICSWPTIQRSRPSRACPG